MNKTIPAIFMVAVFFLLTLQPVVDAAMEDTEVQVNLMPDQQLDMGYQINLNDQNDVTEQNTVVGRWGSDFETFGSPIPKGVFYGSVYENAEWTYNYENPSETYGMSAMDVTTQRLTYFVFIMTGLFLNETVLMNGASEFWYSVPMRPDPTLIFSPPNKMATWVGSFIRVSCPRKDLNNIESTQELTGYYREGRFYAKCNIPVLPSIEGVNASFNDSYAINVFLALQFSASKPSFYISDELLGRGGRTPLYLSNVTPDTYRRLDGKLANSSAPDTRIWGDSFCIIPASYFNTNEPMEEFLMNYFTTEQSRNFIYLPYDISFGYSFVFTEGIGGASCIGIRKTITSDTALIFTTTLYPAATAGDSYLSVYLPFISIMPLELEKVIFRIEGTGTFDDTTTEDDVTWNDDQYMDFLLLSSYKKVDTSSLNSWIPDPTKQILSIEVEIHFNITWEGVFLFYLNYDSYTFVETTIQEEIYDYPEFGDYLLRLTKISDDLNLQVSVMYTQGQWAQISTFGNGSGYRVTYFPIEMYVGTNIYYIQLANESTPREFSIAPVVKLYNWAAEGVESIWNGAGGALSEWTLGAAVKYLVAQIQKGLEGIVNTIYTVGKAIYGWIKSGISWIINKLESIGKMIMSWVKKFVGAIKWALNYIREKILPIVTIFLLMAIAWAAVITIGFFSKYILQVTGEAE